MKVRLLILAFILSISCQINGQDKNENYANLASKIDLIINESEFNGVILVANDSTDIYSKAIGYSDLERRIQIEIDDQFVIGSISKQITAVLVLREYEKGNLRIDDKIDKYIKEIDQTWSKKVTIHHLLTHTHGISNVEEPLKFKEGSQFKYSQLGYELLAQVLEEITGKTFEPLHSSHKCNNFFFIDKSCVNFIGSSKPEPFSWSIV